MTVVVASTAAPYWRGPAGIAAGRAAGFCARCAGRVSWRGAYSRSPADWRAPVRGLIWRVWPVRATVRCAVVAGEGINGESAQVTDARSDGAGDSGTPSRALVPYNPRKYERDKARVERGFWDKVRRTLNRVPFLDEAVAAWFCAVDPSTPLRVKAVLMGALAYFVVPADMVPDFLALLGYTDDAAVLAAAIRTVQPYITDNHRAQAREALRDEGLDETGGSREP